MTAPPVKLTRWSRGMIFGPREYRIDNTAISVRERDGRWELISSEPAGRGWLAAQQLHGARLPTRTAALRAYTAVADLNQPPAAPPQPTLRRTRPGVYECDGAIVTRHPTRKFWTVKVGDRDPTAAHTLADAAEIIAEAAYQAVIAEGRA